MKLKKILATLTAVLTLGSVCALTACGGGDGEIGVEVTKEEWIAAFSEENFTNAKMELVQKQFRYYEEEYEGNVIKETIETTEKVLIIFADNIKYIKEQTTAINNYTKETYERTVEYYYSDADGEKILYEYDSEEKIWKISVEDADYFDEYFEAYVLYGAGLEDYYDDCTFDTKKGGYVRSAVEEDEDEITYDTHFFKFKDKKVCNLSFEFEKRMGDTIIMEALVNSKIKYGGQSLTLPNVD